MAPDQTPDVLPEEKAGELVCNFNRLEPMVVANPLVRESLLTQPVIEVFEVRHSHKDLMSRAERLEQDHVPHLVQDATRLVELMLRSLLAALWSIWVEASIATAL